VVDDAVVIGIDVFEQAAHPLYFVAVLSQLVLQDEMFEIGGGQVALLELSLLDAGHYQVDHFSLVAAD